MNLQSRVENINSLISGSNMRTKLAIILLIFCNTCFAQSPVRLVTHEQRIDVLMNENLFTSYLFSDSLAKPVLYPVRSSTGDTVTRMFPLRHVAGESDDHPHHCGVWFAVNEVNGNEFWKNTETSPQIRLSGILQAANDSLIVEHSWIDTTGTPILSEWRLMQFLQGENYYMIDFEFRLRALVDIHIEDTKEGLFAIRVADWLREQDGSGEFLNSDGYSSEINTWGRRARWMRLQGHRNNRQVGIVIINHPESFNYPTYWMNRGYGLFAANPFGQLVYQQHHGIKMPTASNLTLTRGETVFFGFKLIVYTGNMEPEQIDKIANQDKQVRD